MASHRSGRGASASAAEPRGARAIREVNRTKVIELVRREGQISRSELSRRTGLTKPTISAIAVELMDEGILREVGLATSAGGRPARLLELDSTAASFAGFHFGERTTTVALADAHGRIHERRSCEAVHGAPAESIKSAVVLLGELLRASRTPRARLRAAGVSVPGLVEPGSGRAVIAPNLSWRNVDLGLELETRLGAPVVVANTTQAAALAEGRLGAARGARSYVWVYVGDGVGAGVVIDGRLEYGAHGFAGEIGHCSVLEDGPACGCGRRGCLETVASNAAIVRGAEEQGVRARDKPAGGRRVVTGRDVVRAASNGDAAAQRVLARVGDYLGLGVSYLINILNPQMVIIGGDLVPTDPWTMEALRVSALRRSIRPEGVEILPTVLGEDAYLAGAVLLAQDRGSPSYRIVDDALR